MTEIDLDRFLAADFAGRIALANKARGARLWSKQLAEVWSAAAARLEETGVPDRSAGQVLLREMIALAPDDPAALQAFRRWIGDDARNGASATVSIVHLIVSCEKYKTRAMALHARLAERLQPCLILLGGGDGPDAVFDEPFVIVPAADNYESLTPKVLEGLVAVRRRFGPVGVLKIDDDTLVAGPPRPDRIAALAAATQYAGQIAGGAEFDRCWHAGKCEQRSDEPYRGRYHGTWAGGPLYYLGPQAVELLVREYVFFPGEFDGHLYEDKAVADALRHHRILPEEIALGDVFGLAIAGEAPPQVEHLRLSGKTEQTSRTSIAPPLPEG